jgi:putative membrane protein
MQKASEFFTQDQQAEVEAAIAEAETKTSCEFVTVMASASGRYDRAEDIAGLWLGGIFLVIAWLKWPIEQVTDGSWSASSNTLHYAGWLAILAIGFVIGAVASAKLGKLRMLFTPRQEKLEEVESKAKMAFFDQRMHSTDGGTGVLIYISLFEQMVTILTDETVQSHVNDDEVAKHCAVVATSLAKASPEGLVSTIQALGESLATPLPCAVDDVDELDNAIVFVD